MANCIFCPNTKGWPVSFSGRKFAVCLKCIETDEIHKESNREKIAAIVGPGNPVTPVKRKRKPKSTGSDNEPTKRGRSGQRKALRPE